MKRPADLKLTLKQYSDNKKTPMPGQDNDDIWNRWLSQDAGTDLYDCSQCFLLGFFDSYT